MTPRARKAEAKGGEAGMVRTTLLLPEALWRAAKVRALDEGDLRTVMIRALEEYLARPGRAKEDAEMDPARERLRENLMRPVDALRLSTRPTNCLRNSNIGYIYE